MPDPILRLTLLVPGPPASVAEWNQAMQPHRLRVEGEALLCPAMPGPVGLDFIENDGTFGEAFGFGSVPGPKVREIERVPGALLLQCPADLGEGRQAVLSLVESLRDCGALAVRLEESKLGWEVNRWLELVGSDNPWARHQAAVVFLRGEGTVQSNGMHAFSLPDARVELEGDPTPAQELATVLNVYQLAEDPLLLSGQTFSPDAETPRRVLERWPDTEYPPGHPCHNPYGVWRLGPPGGQARPQPALVPVFLPSLASLLTAREGKAGRPLSGEELLSTRDKAVCMAMKPEDARKLERSRGYADINPELLVEQWPLLRPGAKVGKPTDPAA